MGRFPRLVVEGFLRPSRHAKQLTHDPSIAQVILGPR